MIFEFFMMIFTKLKMCEKCTFTSCNSSGFVTFDCYRKRGVEDPPKEKKPWKTSDL